MYLPEIRARPNNKIQYVSFLGLNERDKIQDEQFLDMKNMSSDRFPCLSPCKGKRNISGVPSSISAITAPKYEDSQLTSFTGVSGTDFYYNGVLITKNNGVKLTAGDKSIVDFYGRICIFPDKVYYSYLPDSSGKLEKMEKTVTLSSGVTFHSSTDKYGDNYESYISKSGADFDKSFKTGDSVVISGCTNQKGNNSFVVDTRFTYPAEEDIISVIVEKAESTKLYVRCYNKLGAAVMWKGTSTTDSNDVTTVEATESNITVKVAIPDMTYVCVHNNRLWGTGQTNEAAGKDHGEFIYASKLGDCFNFNTFQGLTTDSWYGTIGTDGAFTGIASYRQTVVVFKKNYIHHVYGDKPFNFSIPKQLNGGCIDYRSIVELRGVLYFLGSGGFYAYTGGEAEIITEILKTKYEKAVCGSDGVKYYACGYDNKKEACLLVYDPRYGVWHKEDNTKYVGFIRYNGKLYGATSNGMYILGEGSFGDWYVVSKKFTEDTMMHKAVNNIFLRLDLEEGSEVKVSYIVNGNDSGEPWTIKGKGFLTHRVPIRFNKGDSYQIKLDGKGDVTIHDIEKVLYANGYNIR